MRGSHPGSYETAFAVRDGRTGAAAPVPIDTGERYDLIIVGAGLGGLAAAHFYRARKPDARILILDNHDDFGGHTKRNEFTVDGRRLLANGGTWAIELPFPYSTVAHGLLVELGSDPPQLERRDHHPEYYRGLGRGVFFSREVFGVDRFAGGMPDGDGASASASAPSRRTQTAQYRRQRRRGRVPHRTRDRERLLRAAAARQLASVCVRTLRRMRRYAALAAACDLHCRRPGNRRNGNLLRWVVSRCLHPAYSPRRCPQQRRRSPACTIPSVRSRRSHLAANRLPGRRRRRRVARLRRAARRLDGGRPR